ncbi:MAG TPA: alanine--tRNA ligase [Bryobacteraceae bacterium]|nr:alanine--tRNA ligase [Bryobacteraceae bacterium]
MTGNEIRQKFLDYFASHGHRIVRSSSLVPANDPTLLFANAGMNQFKDVFTGLEKRDYSRATTAQKCVRAGGKHNDLDNVGYTRRHHTFFEMLGNFSFGDYFKKDAIAFAWELVSKEFALSKDRLYITVFREDDDAENLWQQVAGVPKSRIFRLDEADNFWQMGDAGPCGPCSEIYYDFGPEAGPGEFPASPGERFVEIWNLVFMQFERSLDGKMTPLPRPSIDTGMGLERTACALQGVISNYDTDLLKPIINRAADLFGVSYGENDRTNVALRINADHARATAFLIHDGVVPSNEGRGYVLRKIMRRAIRNARMIGRQEPYLYELTGFIAELMKPGYPEMMESIQRVARVVKEEEHRYATTFQVAEKVFLEEAKGALEEIKKAREGQLGSYSDFISGQNAFKLYDTYGLALDEQDEMARELGLKIDHKGFEDEMEKQRTRARASWKGADKTQIPAVYRDLPQTEFIGRETLEAPVKVLRVIEHGGQHELVFDRTPFYAESGGQVGDTGALYSPTTGDRIALVLDTYKPSPNAIVHKVEELAGIQEGDELTARVDKERRQATMRNHTATHLLHAALRTVLGTHVKQAGSVVDPNRLRFDFTHYAHTDPEELTEIQKLVNGEILKNIALHTDIMDLDQAVNTGAMALFGEKYGDRVRVVSIPGFSKELCGGTHVHRTGDIGLCVVTHESGISAGVRRIEAITGEAVLDKLRDDQNASQQAQEKLTEEKRSLERQLDQLKNELARAQVGDVASGVKEIKGVKVLAAQVRGMDREQLRTMVDSLRGKFKTGVVVLASTEDSNVSIVSGVTKDLTNRVHAGKLVGAVAQAVGGKGGGRPDMAEAGGKNPAALPEALDAVYTAVAELL